MRNKNIQKISFVIVLTGLLSVPFSIYADTSSDIAAQKQAKQAQLDQLNAQIKNYQNQIAVQQKQAASLSNEIKLYDIEIKATDLQIQATQTNIDNTNLQIEDLKAQILQKTQQIEQEKQILGQLIVSINEMDNVSTLQLSLGTNNFSDFLDQVQYTESLQQRVYDLLNQIKQIKAKLVQNESDLQTSLDKLNQLQDQLQITQQTLNDQKSSKVQLLAQTKGQQSRYLQLLTATQDAEAKVQQEMYNLDRQASGKATYSPLPVVHGILAWPIDGVITQGYGSTGFTQLGYNFHNGIDIAAPAGTPIYAAADGIVYATGTGQAAYGNWVAIKHAAGGKLDRDIITLYGHMSRFVVTPGQQMKQGDLVGYEGNTGNTTRLLYGPDHGFHVHFSVFDANGFGIAQGEYTKIYGPYQVPYGHTYDPMDFL